LIIHLQTFTQKVTVRIGRDIAVCAADQKMYLPGKLQD